MPARRLPWSIRLAVALLATGLSLAQAQPARTPRQLIDHLGVEIRQILEDPKSDRKPADAERAVAEQITALIAAAEGHPMLTERDPRGRTPLMLAVSGGYPLVVKALLADPSVKFQINIADTDGETAWMLANFAPVLTLVACQPGALTMDRAPLLPPYLRRMSHLLQTQAAGIVSIIQALEAAGAEPVPEAAKQVWLARCPNATPELRQALATGELASTLINEAVARQLAFNKSVADNFAVTPDKPPAEMKFIAPGNAQRRTAPAPLLLKVGDIHCARMPKPQLGGNFNWSGEILFKAIVATRAGVVEAVDFEFISGDKHKPAVDYFRNITLRALAGYQCDGDHVFEQEFQIKIR